MGHGAPTVKSGTSSCPSGFELVSNTGRIRVCSGGSPWALSP